MGHVLVIDDDPLLLKSLRDTLAALLHLRERAGRGGVTTTAE